jgi:hypothetical protein
VRLVALLALAVASAAALPAVAAQETRAPAVQQPLSAPRSATSDVFRRFADGVVKVQVVETGSAAKAVIGSGFYVSADGDVVTNYHVISKLVHAPERYRAEAIDAAGASHRVTLRAFDVINDLALLRADARPATFFALEDVRVEQGDRLYSLGHPRDLGLSIVEGTYNGLLQHALYPKIHFTGSLNPGMSGGPTIDPDGRVVGVNVSTEREQVSFLVPLERVLALVRRAGAADFKPAANHLAEVGRQILTYQDAYLANLFADSTPTVALGPYTLPTEPARFFKCWADARREKRELPYELVRHRCSTDDYLFISEDQWSGILEIEHVLVQSKELNPMRFAALQSSQFRGEPDFFGMFFGTEEEVTRYRCETRNVRQSASDDHQRALTMRTVFCVRRYRRLPGLYDAVVKAASLGGGDTGLVTTLTLSGVSFENAQRVARRYLERIAWQTK